MIKEIKALLKAIRTDWEVNVLGKKPRNSKGRYVKRRKRGN